MKIITTLIITLSMMVVSTVSGADLTGKQIIEKVYNRKTPKDQQAILKMSLVNRQGKKRVRKIKQTSKKFGDVEKSIMFFMAPSDIKNTSFMNWSYTKPNKDDDQWIYLPAIKRVKRISSDSKSDYFMGSDFTYDDLGDRHPSKDIHKLLRVEKYKGEECYVIESKPKNKDYFYSKTITWVVKGKWIGLKRDFYDEDGEMLKTLTVEKYEKIDDYYIITNSVMNNKQKKHKTVMALSKIKIDRDISSKKFTERMMKRGIK